MSYNDNKDRPGLPVPVGGGSSLVPSGMALAPGGPPAEVGGNVNQAQNIALGDIAGGGIDKSTHLHGDVIVSSSETQLARLYRELKEQVDNDEQLTEYIEQLQIFTRKVDNEDVVGLDGKFAAASRNDQLIMAKQLKELVYRQLRKNVFSRTFQTIYATLLGQIYEKFDTYVRPAILSGASRGEIDSLVHERVVSPIIAELARCPHCNDAPVQTVRGMLYFLTGNCHIVWHR